MNSVNQVRPYSVHSVLTNLHIVQYEFAGTVAILMRMGFTAWQALSDKAGVQFPLEELRFSQNVGLNEH